MRTTTDWTFGGSWPYEPKYFETPDGRMHYIDEGPRDARPVVMVHGNPSWGYLYRNFVGPVVDAGYRVVVPDHLGMGRSDKPDRRSVYTIPKHAARFVALMDSLGLEDATVVCQDWGGPIGLSWPAKRPRNVRSLYIMNTGARPADPGTKLPKVLTRMRAPIVGELAIKGAHLFVRFGLFKALRKDRLTPQLKEAYLAPHPTYKSRTAVLEFPRQIPDGPDHPVSQYLREVHDGLMVFKDRPVAFAWGKHDIVFRPKYYEMKWKPDFPDAPILWLDRAGHFLQEDAPEEIVPNLIEFLKR